MRTSQIQGSSSQAGGSSKTFRSRLTGRYYDSSPELNAGSMTADPTRSGHSISERLHVAIPMLVEWFVFQGEEHYGPAPSPSRRPRAFHRDRLGNRSNELAR